MAVAVVTGGSKGLGRALAAGLAERGWGLVIDARGAAALEAAAGELRRGSGPVVALRGDVADPAHRRALVEAATGLGGLDLLVNNASTLGVSPLPPLVGYPLEEWRRVYEVNVVAPLALVQLALPLLRVSGRPRVLNVTSDAAVEPYPRWGAYGSAKAALDQLSAVLGAEEPGVAVYAFDPGDLRTEMHQAAFPGEDISDRPPPESVVAAFLALLESELPSGRYRAADLGSLLAGAPVP